jgi:nucleotide-binding universal stress UspA family protein
MEPNLKEGDVLDKQWPANDPTANHVSAHPTALAHQILPVLAQKTGIQSQRWCSGLHLVSARLGQQKETKSIRLMKTRSIRNGRTTGRSRRMATPKGAPTFALPRVSSILVPVDFSDHSQKALSYAAALARNSNVAVTLLHVVEPIAMPDFEFHPLMREREDLAKSATQRLATLANKVGLGGPNAAKVLVRHGTPFFEITGAARTLKTDLIVIATHGYTGIKHVLLGSTAERVVRHAGCPVLVVR